MNPTLTVYAYGNVDALHGIFNAIAMIMNSGDFEHMVRLGVVIGFLVVATLSMFPGNFSKGWTWFLAVTVISGVMLVPKASVAIVDRTGMQPTVVVANVPWTLAVLANLKSAVGATLTETFETAFQTIPSGARALPSELSYLSHGMMFGSRLVRTSLVATPENLYDRSDLTQYVRNCVLPEQGRILTPNQLEDSASLVTVMANTNPALASGYHDPGNNWKLDVQPCPVVWANLLPRLNAAGANAVVKAASTTMAPLFQANRTAAVATVDAAIPAIYGKATLASASATAADIMVQNILINATADAAATQAAAINDTGTLMLAMMRTQAVSQMNAGNMVQGRIAEEALPIVRNITEGILFACFPVLCILLVASEARAMGALFKSYAYALIWVELWPPMFAIVNYLQTLEAAKQMAGSAFTSGATGLSMSTASAVYSTSVSSLGTTAWMVTFVPILAAAVLFGFDRIMTITGAMGGGVRAAQSEAGSSTKGNLSMGGVSFDQRQLAAYESSPSTYTTQSVGGSQTVNMLTGERVSTYASSRHLSSANAMASIGEGVSASAQASVASAQRNGKAFEAAVDAAFSDSRTALQSYSAAASEKLGYDITKITSNGLAESEVDEVARRLSKQHDIADASAVRKELGLALGGAAASLVGLKAAGSTAESEDLRRSFGSAVDALRRKGLARKQEIAETFRSGEGFEEARRSNRDASQRVDATLREATGYREAESRDLTRSKQLSSQWDAFQRYAQSQSTDFSNLVEREYQVRGMSVHDGVADPRRHAEVVRSLFEQGSFRTDGPDGLPMFIPASAGFGPSEALVAPAAAVRDQGERGLQSEFGQLSPGGGRAGVQAQAGANVEREGAVEGRLGVNPTRTVGGGTVPARVTQGQAAAETATTAAAVAARQAQGDAQLAHDKRVAGVSTKHKPVFSEDLKGQQVRNPALDGVRFDPKPFPDEARAEEVKREAAARAESAKKDASANAPSAAVQIPTKPNE